MENNNHTQGEWKCKNNKVFSYSEKEPIAIISNYSNDKECEANAKLIVKAVNNHEKLIEALQNIIDNNPGTVKKSIIEAIELVESIEQQ